MKNRYTVVIFLILSILALSMSACASYEYDGKEISSIIHESIDYFGGYTNETKIDLIDGQVLSRAYFPTDGSDEAYSIDYHFDTQKVAVFLDEVGDAGLFDLKDHYPSPEGIMDGGGWTLTINYIDGTNKTSTGSNNYPTQIFEKCDYAFYNLYGDDLFQTLPTSYTNPPSIDIAFDYSIDSNTNSYGYGLSAINYTWHNTSVDHVDVIEYAKSKQQYDFNSEYAYTLVLWTANYNHRFSNMEITSFDLQGNDQKEVDDTGWFKQKTYTLELNRIYVITMIFDYGTCTYAFSTIVD